MYELSLDYPNYRIQKWYTWTDFQASRARFSELQEPIWLTVINEICKFQPHLELFFQMSRFFELSWVHPNYVILKKLELGLDLRLVKRFVKKVFKVLQPAGLTVVNEIPDFSFLMNSLCHMNYKFPVFLMLLNLHHSKRNDLS